MVIINKTLRGRAQCKATMMGDAFVGGGGFEVGPRAVGADEIEQSRLEGYVHSSAIYVGFKLGGTATLLCNAARSMRSD